MIKKKLHDLKDPKLWELWLENRNYPIQGAPSIGVLGLQGAGVELGPNPISRPRNKICHGKAHVLAAGCRVNHSVSL